MDSNRSSGPPADEPYVDEPQDATLSSVIREVGAEARARREPHPDPAELIDYSQGELDRAAAARVLAHLEACSDCAQTVLDLGELSRFEAAPEDPSPEEIAVRWRGFEQGLASRAEPSKSEGKVESFAPRARPVGRSWRVPATWAAALLIAFFLLLVVGREGSTPRPNVHVASLAPVAQSLTRDAIFEPLHVPATADRFVLILNLTDRRSFARYRLDVERSAEIGDGGEEVKQGEKVWQSEDLRRAEPGNFTVEFERRFLDPGRYLVLISGLGDGEPVILARYALELVYK